MAERLHLISTRGEMTMNVSKAEFQFPVIGFEPDTLGWQFTNLGEMTECHEAVLKTMWPEVLDFVDAGGRRWTVKGVRREGRAGGLASWFLGALLGGARCRIDYDLEPRSPVTLSEVQDMACAAMQAFRDDDDYTEDRKAETAQLLVQIKQTKSIAELAPVLNWPSFANF